MTKTILLRFIIISFGDKISEISDKILFRHCNLNVKHYLSNDIKQSKKDLLFERILKGI